METPHSSIKAYWQSFLATLPPDSTYHGRAYIAEGFGDSPELADKLGALIVNGIKTATCSALWEWEAEGEPLPSIGQLTLILDGQGYPLCITEAIEVALRRYDEVDAQFAAEEGEGDRSLSYWRDAHWHFFTRVLAAFGKEPTLDMPLVCERFRVIFS